MVPTGFAPDGAVVHLLRLGARVGGVLVLELSTTSPASTATFHASALLDVTRLDPREHLLHRGLHVPVPSGSWLVITGNSLTAFARIGPTGASLKNGIL